MNDNVISLEAYRKCPPNRRGYVKLSAFAKTGPPDEGGFWATVDQERQMAMDLRVFRDLLSSAKLDPDAV